MTLTSIGYGDLVRELAGEWMEESRWKWIVDLGESLQISMFTAKIGFDTAENQSRKVCPLSVKNGKNGEVPVNDLERMAVSVVTCEAGLT